MRSLTFVRDDKLPYKLALMPPSPPLPLRIAPFLLWLLSGLVFFVLPFLLLAYGLGNHWEAIEADAREREYKRLDSLILTLFLAEDTESYLQGLLHASFQRCIRAINWKQAVADEFGLLRARFPGLFELVALERDGRLMRSVSDPIDDEQSVRNLYDFMRGLHVDGRPKEEMLPQLRRETLRFLGPCAAIDQLIWKKGGLREGQMSGRRRFYDVGVGSGGFLLTFLDQIPEWKVLPAGDQTRKRNERLRMFGLEAGVFDLRGERFHPPFPIRLAPGLENSEWCHLSVGNRLFSLFALTPTGRVWAASDQRRLPNLTPRRIALNVLGNLLVGCLLLASYRAWRRRVLIPLRTRMVLLFVFACALPLLLIQVVGWDYLHDLRRRRVAEYHDHSERLLRSFDGRFRKERKLLENILTNRFRDLLFLNPKDRAEVQKKVREVLTDYRGMEAGVVDEDGHLVWIQDTKERYQDPRHQQFLGKVVAQVLARLNRQPSTDKLDPTFMLIDSITGLGDPIQRISEQVGQIFNFFRYRNQAWSYFLPIHREGGRHRFMLVIHWARGDLERFFLGIIINRLHENNSDLGFYGRNPVFADEVESDPIPFRRHIPRLINALELRSVPVFDAITVGRRGYLVTGLKSKEMGEFCLLAYKEDQVIRDELAWVRNGLFVFSLVCMGISVFLGIGLGSRFLDPIGHLTRGVDAIKRREFETRIPVLCLDELGVLSKTFNQVMSGMSELEIGRIVQESLFPRQDWRWGEYMISARTQPAGELTGDYFDLMVLPDRRILFLVGDVTGHGLPAALVMAMTKAIFVGEVGRAREPHEFLQPVHRILLQIMKRRRMMTCFLGILDPRKHTLNCANAGHNFPVFFRPGSAPEQIEQSCMPLGSWKTAKFSSYSLEVVPGEQVLFYSDGLVEAAVGGEPIGVNTMIAATRQVLSPDPAVTCGRLLAWQKDLVGKDALQADDITVLVLARKNGGMEKS